MRACHAAYALLLLAWSGSGCGGASFQGASDEGDGASSSTGAQSSGAGKNSTPPGEGGDDSVGTGGAQGTGEGGDDGGGGRAVAGSGGSGSAGGPVGGGTAGGPATGGSGGVPGGGNAGTVSVGGGNNGGGGSGNMAEGPLRMADLLGIDSAGFPSFHAAGFRCKSLSVCGAAQSCIYYLGFLGSIQSAEETYSDGDELAESQAVKIHISGGAQSMCAASDASLVAGEAIKLSYDGNKTITVYFPAFKGGDRTVYVAADGRTYYDAALKMPAGPP